jgi:pyrroloquinoline quinone biosynthesis protein B
MIRDFIKLVAYSFFTVCILSCSNQQGEQISGTDTQSSQNEVTQTSLIVLGTVQDAGSPHIACKKDCCKDLFSEPDKQRKVVALGVVDPVNGKKYLFDATPDITEQARHLKELEPANIKETPDAIFLTHAHIGHYTGLMYLGKEAMNSDRLPVYAMPLMKRFLEDNGPWSQLVSNQNIVIQEMSDGTQLDITSNVKITPFFVPHRDEYSETVGFIIEGPEKKVLFIPDIDKWERWDRDIIVEISKVDYAFIDATFYDGEEVNKRDISEIPHPFVIESMSLFRDLSRTEKNKIYFIHLNHTNPLLNPLSEQSKLVVESGFNIAETGDIFTL